MAIQLIKEEYSFHANAMVREFICDTDADFADLPTSCVGSTAVSVATGNVYVVNASGYWVEFGGGETGGGETFEQVTLITYVVSGSGGCYITYTNIEGEEATDYCALNEEAYSYNVKTGTSVSISGNYSSVDLVLNAGETLIGSYPYNEKIPLPNNLSDTLYLMIIG